MRAHASQNVSRRCSRSKLVRMRLPYRLSGMPSLFFCTLSEPHLFSTPPRRLLRIIKTYALLLMDYKYAWLCMGRTVSFAILTHCLSPRSILHSFHTDLELDTLHYHYACNETRSTYRRSLSTGRSSSLFGLYCNLQAETSAHARLYEESKGNITSCTNLTAGSSIGSGQVFVHLVQS